MDQHFLKQSLSLHQSRCVQCALRPGLQTAVCADTRLRVPGIRPARAICPACLHMQRALVLGTCLLPRQKQV